MSSRSFIALVLVLTAGACGPDDGNNGNNSSNNTSDNNAPANNAGGIVDILPDGYDSVAAGRFSPDGSRLAMVATPPGDGPEELITTDLSGGDVEVLVVGGLSYLTTIAWMPDGQSVVYGGGQGIMEVGLDASEPRLLVDAFAVESVDLSADGGNVTWSVNGGTTVTTAPLSDEPTPADEHIAGPTGDMPRFATTGSRIAFVSSDGVTLSEPNGDDAETIEADTHFFSNLAWRDEGTIVVLTDFGITELDVDTGSVTDLHEEFAAIGLDVSPDGEMFVVGINGQPALRVGPL